MLYKGNITAYVTAEYKGISATTKETRGQRNKAPIADKQNDLP